MQTTGESILEDTALVDVPHTISFALNYRSRINSFNEHPKDKRPPRNLWDKPHRLSEFFEEVYKSPKDKSQDYIEYDMGEVE